MRSLDFEGFHHPCKDVCSDWRQGYEAGINLCIRKVREQKHALALENDSLRQAIAQYVYALTEQEQLLPNVQALIESVGEATDLAKEMESLLNDKCNSP